MIDPESPGGRVRITVKPLGTIVIHGEVWIEDREGNEIPQPPAKNPGMVKLCGCGRSGTRPFCDGSHKCGEKAVGQ